MKELLIEVSNEKFKADSVYFNLKKTICNRAEIKIYDDCKSVVYKKNGLLFKLKGVRVNSEYRDNEMEPLTFCIRLDYLCCSKVDSKRRSKIKEANDNYDNDKHFGWSNRKIPLWEILSYSIDSDRLIDNNITLTINE